MRQLVFLLCLFSTPALAMHPCRDAARDHTAEEKVQLWTACLYSPLSTGERASVHYNRAVAYMRLGKHANALADFDRAVELVPRFAPAFSGRGMTYLDMGSYDQAAANFELSLTYDQREYVIANDNAWFRATCPDPKHRDGALAVKFARRAVDQRDVAATHDTLAAALAEQGQFAEAITEEERAISRAEPSIRPFYEQRLAMYRSDTPYRSLPGTSAQW